jgi:hypothetical protein
MPRDSGFNGKQKETGMAGKAKTIGLAFVVAVLSIASAHGQGMGRKGSHAAAPSEHKPRVDEKAYKAALDRIPTPKKPYDPWGQVHDAAPAKSSNK